MPKPLDTLLTKLRAAVIDVTATLEADPAQVATWQQEMARLLKRYHTAAYLAGTGDTTLDANGRAAVANEIKAQLQFLDNFAIDIQSGEEWKRGWIARAEMYAEAIKVPYWTGKTKMLPLPAMPAQGTQCLTRCNCIWDVQSVDKERGDYDAYWRLGASDHCQVCVERAQEWSPLQIRNGELQ